MHDLASEFSKIFRGLYSRTPQREGATPSAHPARTPSPACGRTRGASDTVLGPKPWSPQLFSRSCAPWLYLRKVSMFRPDTSNAFSELSDDYCTAPRQIPLNWRTNSSDHAIWTPDLAW